MVPKLGYAKSHVCVLTVGQCYVKDQILQKVFDLMSSLEGMCLKEGDYVRLLLESGDHDLLKD